MSCRLPRAKADQNTAVRIEEARNIQTPNQPSPPSATKDAVTTKRPTAAHFLMPSKPSPMRINAASIATPRVTTVAFQNRERKTIGFQNKACNKANPPIILNATLPQMSRLPIA